MYIILILILPFEGYCPKDYNLRVIFIILALALFDPDWTPCKAIMGVPPPPLLSTGFQKEIMSFFVKRERQGSSILEEKTSGNIERQLMTPNPLGGPGAKPKDVNPCKRNEQNFFATATFRLALSAFQDISCSHFLQSFRKHFLF